MWYLEILFWLVDIAICLNIIIIYMYTMADRGKFLPCKFLNLVRILFLPKCCALPHMYYVHFLTTKTNNFLFNFELNQVYNNIIIIADVLLSAEWTSKSFFWFHELHEKKKKSLLEFVCFLSETFNDPDVILVSFYCLWWSFGHKANTLTTLTSGFKYVQ